MKKPSKADDGMVALFPRGRLLAAVAMLLLASGCARFEYSIVEPANFAQTIGKQEVRIPYEPLEYRMMEAGDRLAIQIVNPGNQAVTLSSGRSYLVDPKGASHALPATTIGPRSFVALNLPPAPMILRAEPSISFGFGLGHFPHRRRFHRHSHLGLGIGWGYDPFYDGFYESRPRYYAVNTPEHWEWRTGEVRMHLGFDRPEQPFDHEFVFQRNRVK